MRTFRVPDSARSAVAEQGLPSFAVEDVKEFHAEAGR